MLKNKINHNDEKNYIIMVKFSAIYITYYETWDINMETILKQHIKIKQDRISQTAIFRHELKYK